MLNNNNFKFIFWCLILHAWGFLVYELIHLMKVETYCTEYFAYFYNNILKSTSDHEKINIEKPQKNLVYFKYKWVQKKRTGWKNKENNLVCQKRFSVYLALYRKRYVCKIYIDWSLVCIYKIHTEIFAYFVVWHLKYFYSCIRYNITFLEIFQHKNI